MSKTTKTTTNQVQNAVANTSSANSGSEAAFGVGGNSTSNSNTLGASDFSKPFVNSALSGITGAFGQSQDMLEQYSPQIGKGLESVMAGFGKTDPGLDASNNYANSVLGGGYLNGNGYLQQALETAGNRARDMTNASVGARGAAGGSIQADMLSRNISDAQNGVLNQNYQNERQQQTQAAQIAAMNAQAQNNSNSSQLQQLISMLSLPQALAGQYAAQIAAMNAQAQNNSNSSQLQQLISMLSLPQALAGQYGQQISGQVGNYNTSTGQQDATNYTAGQSSTNQTGTSNTTGTQTTNGTGTQTESGGLLGSILGGLASGIGGGLGRLIKA